MKRHIVPLDLQARGSLEPLVRSGIRPVQVVRRCQILLKLDLGSADEEIAQHVGCTTHNVRAVRKRFCEEGLERSVYNAPHSGRPPEFTERQQQQVITLAGSEPPEGRVRWTLERLCEHAVKEGFVESISVTGVSLWLKENDLKPWRNKLSACPS